jgi:hypothetical protein
MRIAAAASSPAAVGRPDVAGEQTKPEVGESCERGTRCDGRGGGGVGIERSRSVRFADEGSGGARRGGGSSRALASVVGTVPSRLDWSQEELGDRYLCPGEFRAIRLLAEFDAREAALCGNKLLLMSLRHSSLSSSPREERGQPPGVCVVEALDAAFEAVACLTEILDEDLDLERFVVDPSDVARPLCSAWHDHPDLAGGHRGLERWVSEVQDVERYEGAADARRAVLLHGCGGGSRDEDGAAAALYRNKSRFSAVYARVMGEADAIAASAVHRAKAGDAIAGAALSARVRTKNGSQQPGREKATASRCKAAPQIPGARLQDTARHG